MNHKIEEPHKLLTPEGILSEAGWATKLIMEYNPFDIKAHKLRLKEWDYYIVIDDDGYGFSLTVSDNRYFGLINANIFDFNENKKQSFSVPLLFPMGNLNLPADSSHGDIIIRKKFYDISVTHEKRGRRLKGVFRKSPIYGEMEFDIFLHEYTGDTMVIATPWKEDETAFYYNQKINCMPADGYVKHNGKTHYFNPEKDFGTLDWGRGVWTYDNTWYWSSCNGIINDKLFGFNLGYGFGDTSAASENMIFYDGKCHKLDRVLFEIPDDIMKPWKFVSSDGRLDMDFEPIYNDIRSVKVGFISQSGNQIFGRFSGTAILDDGTILEFADLTGFAEKIRNKY